MNNRTTKVLIVSILIALVCIIALYIEFRIVTALNDKSDTLKESLVNAQVQSLKLESLRAVAISGSAELDKIENYIVSAGKEIELVQQIENLAKNSGLEYSTDLIEKKEGVDTTKDMLHIKILTNGSWSTSRKFISLIEHLPYNVRINELDMIKSGESTGSTTVPTWRTNVDFSVVQKKVTQ